ncbi:hypothetical protein Q7P37_002789 [Cladosporium fusiforme]
MLFSRLARSSSSITPQFFKPITTNTTRNFSFTAARMGVTKKQISPGNGVDKPKAGDTIIMDSVGRGDFRTKIGVGQLIKGWDEGIIETDGGMSLGEKATLLITGDYAYGDRGFPGLIPANATLIFDVQLKGINNKSM